DDRAPRTPKQSRATLHQLYVSDPLGEVVRSFSATDSAHVRSLGPALCLCASRKPHKGGCVLGREWRVGLIVEVIRPSAL
ncbi:MAG: hypothetical protein AAF550_03555, partial [Myxococcota bacterium]